MTQSRAHSGQQISLRVHHSLDAKYRLGDLHGAAVPGAVLLRLADSPLLLTAPHSTTHYRQGRQKAAEFWTGALAETLGLLLGGSVITALAPRIEDPDAASEDSFLLAVRHLFLRDQIRLVVDIHGLAARHGIDVNIGTAGRPQQAVSEFSRRLAAHFSVTVNHPYQGVRGLAGAVNRVSDDMHAIQLELGPRLRSDTTTLADLLNLGEAISVLQRETFGDYGS